MRVGAKVISQSRHSSLQGGAKVLGLGGRGGNPRNNPLDKGAMACGGGNGWRRRWAERPAEALASALGQVPTASVLPSALLGGDC